MHCPYSPSHTSQEDEEEPETVKEYELHQEDGPKESLCIAMETFSNDRHEYVEAVDTKETRGDTENVVNIINTEIIACRGVAKKEVDQINCKDESLDTEEDAGAHHHQGQPVLGHHHRLAGVETDEWWRTNC